MMAAMIVCLITQVPDGATIMCSNKLRIRIAGLEIGNRMPSKAQSVLSGLTLEQNVSCQPAGNEGPLIVAKCTLPDRRDLVCTMIKLGAGVRSDVSWRKYGLKNCDQ